MTESIRKGLSFVAFGFLFTLVNINLSFTTGDAHYTLNIMPDFIGWTLFFLAYGKLGSYVQDKPYLKWIAFIMIILTATLWIVGFMSHSASITVLQSVTSILGSIYMFLLFGSLEAIADHYGSSKASLLSFLRYANLAVGCILLLLSLLKVDLSVYAVVGTMGLVLAIITAVVLFGLRSDVQNSGVTE